MAIETVDTLIIGGGLSGIYAAPILLYTQKIVASNFSEIKKMYLRKQ
jgi:uncharacterized NAD(P)/FAD-binding protein YdhS